MTITTTDRTATDRLVRQIHATPLRVTLVRPPAVTNIGVKGQYAVPPIGLAYVASSLQSAGHRVGVVDAGGARPPRYAAIPDHRRTVCHGLSADEIAERIDPESQLIGVSCMFSMQWPFDRDVIRSIRRRWPRIPIALGGEHATASWRYILATTPEVDFCVLGEGEETAVALCDALARSRNLSSVGGLAYRAAGEPHRNKPRARIRALDDIPEPNWTLFDMASYVDNDLTWGVSLGTSMPLLATRGCPYRCTFCSAPQMWTPIWGARDPRAVIAEMRRYMAEYGAKSFNLYDLTAIVRRDWIVELAEGIIRQRLAVTWQLPSGTRTEAIDAKLARLLYRSGCRNLNYAPESGSPAVLKRIKKRVRPERMLQSIRVASQAGLKIKANIILGFPDETPTEVLETYRFVAQMAWAGAEDLGAYPYSPYPGSQMFEELRRQGRVSMNERLFEDLLKATDPNAGVSFSEHFNARQLTAIVLGAMVLFYATAFARRPWRAVRLLVDVVTGGSRTKLAKQVAQARRKRAARRRETPSSSAP